MSQSRIRGFITEYIRIYFLKTCVLIFKTTVVLSLTERNFSETSLALISKQRVKYRYNVNNNDPNQNTNLSVHFNSPFLQVLLRL